MIIVIIESFIKFIISYIEFKISYIELILFKQGLYLMVLYYNIFNILNYNIIRQKIS